MDGFNSHKHCKLIHSQKEVTKIDGNYLKQVEQAVFNYLFFFFFGKNENKIQIKTRGKKPFLIKLLEGFGKIGAPIL